MRTGTRQSSRTKASLRVNTADKSRTLAFSYARVALNNSLSCTTSYVPSSRTSSNNSQVSQKPPKKPRADPRIRADRQDSQPGVHRRSVPSSPRTAFTDLKTYVAAAAQGIDSSGFVWLVTDALGRLGVVATYGASALLVALR